jgi:hypothetical protein
MGFNQRSATPLSFDSSPLLPQADSSQPHDFPTAGNPTTAKLQDWIADHDANLVSSKITVHRDGDAGVYSGTYGTWSGAGTSFAIGSVPFYVEAPNCEVGDKILVQFMGNFEADNSLGADGYNQARFLAEDDGGAYNNSLDGYIAMYTTVAAGLTRHGGVSLIAYHEVQLAGTTRLTLQVARGNAGNVVHLKGGFHVMLTRIR